MSTFVSQQFFEFTVLFYGGIVAAFIYDLVLLYQKYFKPNSFFSVIQDILYWIMVTSIVIYLLYYSSLGKISAYSFIAIFLGFMIYKMLLSKMISKTIEKIFLFLFEGIKFVVKKLCLSFIKVFKK